VTPPRIVRYPCVNEPGFQVAFWFDSEEDVRGVVEMIGAPPKAEECAANDTGWRVDRPGMRVLADPEWCGTTLAAIREALTQDTPPSAAGEE